MKKQIHSNFIKSSNLIFAVIGVGILNFFFSGNTLSNAANITTEVVTLIMIGGLGLLVRQGYNWMKYILLVLTILGLVGISAILSDLAQNPVVGFESIAETILEVWATVLLFKIPKTAESRLAEQKGE